MDQAVNHESPLIKSTKTVDTQNKKNQANHSLGLNPRGEPYNSLERLEYLPPTEDISHLLHVLAKICISNFFEREENEPP
jgi:hypothetical protein